MAAEVPFYLKSTIAMVQTAFPSGVHADEQRALFWLLEPGLSFRNLAELMAHMKGSGSYAELLNEAYAVAERGPGDATILADVRRKLEGSGLSDWLAAE